MKIFSQVLAVLAVSLLMVQMGMSIGYVTILISKLTNKNSTEVIYLNESKTTWLSSLLSITALVGSMVSGAMANYLGRKRSLVVYTVPFFISWIAISFATEPSDIFQCLALHGLTNGIIEAPAMSYVAEITEPRLRGMLSASANVSAAFGVLLEFIICSFLHWKTAALVTCAFPIASFCALLLLPESPHWLLSHNKSDEARRSLAWLRGWTAVENVEQEFQELQNYVNGGKTNAIDNPVFEDASVISSYNGNIETAKKYLNKSFIWPLSLVAALFTCVNFSGLYTLQTYGTVIFATLKVPMNKYHATVIMGLCQVFGIISSMFIIRLCGKRTTGLISLSCLVICNISVGLYAYVNHVSHLNFTSVETSTSEDSRWLPLFLLIAATFAGNCGPRCLPWIIAGEIFSNDTRAVGCGLSSCLYYITEFLSNNVYLSMDSTLTFPGIYWTYACICFIGLVFICVTLPETEGKTLEQISVHFASSNVRRNTKSSRSGQVHTDT